MAKITAEQAIQAARGTKGILSVISGRLGCTRRHVYNLMEKYSSFAEVVAEERESMKDFTESKLFQRIDTGDITAIIFYLKTQAKERGYVEKQQVQNENSGSIEIIIREMSDGD